MYIRYCETILTATNYIFSLDSVPINSDEDYHFTNDPSKLRGKTHLVPIEKREQGFGFTIVGGDDPEEFLQIKSVVSDGAAALTGNIEQGTFAW